MSFTGYFRQFFALRRLHVGFGLVALIFQNLIIPDKVNFLTNQGSPMEYLYVSF